MGGALLKFPFQPVLHHVEAPTPPPLDVIDRGNSKLLLETARYVIDKSKILIEFMTENRLLARQLGLDTVIVELSGIEASGKLESIKDALEETVASGTETRLTVEGLTYLKRAEKLVAETSLAVTRLTGNASGTTPVQGRALGNSIISLEGNNFSDQLIILGLVSVVAFAFITVIFAMSRK
jgi:hypothetical protein